MRSYDPTDKYDIEEAQRLGAKPWQLDLLKLNPSYVSWGPHEDYMTKEGSGWDSRQIRPDWNSFDFGLNDLNECVNFHFSISRDSKDCPVCGGNSYHPDAQWISESFYGHSTPFRPQTRSEREGHAVLASFGGGMPTSVVSNFPSEEVLLRYGQDFRAFCDAMAEGDGEWQDKITEDEVDALWEAKRLYGFKTKPTPEQVNDAQGQRGLSGHDCINRNILIRTRCARFGVPMSCDECDGHGHVFTSPEPHVTLTLWILHPRKGCSRGVEITKLEQSELPQAFAYLKQAAERNAQRFAAIQ